MRRSFLLGSIASSSAAALAAYDAALLARPRVVKSLTGGGLAFLGDLNAQRLEVWGRNRLRSDAECEQAPPERMLFDGRRSFAFTTMGTFWTGLFNHEWYNLLERRLPMAGGGWARVAAKVAMAQLLVNPFVYLPVFYLWTGAVLRRSLKDTQAKAQREYWGMLRATWLVLGSANIVMFSVMPVRFQAVFMCGVSFVYQNILSLLANADRAATRRDE